MSRLNDIINSATELQLHFKPLNTSDYERIFGMVALRYLEPESSYPVWSHIRDSASYRDGNAWVTLSDFISSSCVLFTEPYDDGFAIALENGRSLVELIENMYGFVFYVTNDELDYLLCFNDHDFLIGAGSAKCWVESLLK